MQRLKRYVDYCSKGFSPNLCLFMFLVFFSSSKNLGLLDSLPVRKKENVRNAAYECE